MVTRVAIKLVDADVRIVVVMETQRRVIDLPEVIELVEGAFEKLPVHEEDVDAAADLDNL